MDFFKFVGLLWNATEIVNGRLVIKLMVDLQDADGTQLYLTPRPVDPVV